MGWGLRGCGENMPESPTRIVEKIRLSRRDVARSEVDTAIELLFTGNNHVAINLLAWAAVDVLRGLCQAHGIETFMTRFYDSIRPEFHKEFRETLKDHYNYFKHAKNDPNRVVEDFCPEASTYALLVAVEDYRALFQKLTFPMYVFRSWFMARNPHTMTPLMATLLKQFHDTLGDLSTMTLQRSCEAAGDVLRDYLRDPSVAQTRLAKSTDKIEW